MEQFSENTGHPLLAFIVPFSFPAQEMDDRWDRLTGTGQNSYNSEDLLAGRMPSDDRLRQFFMEDCDEYSREYLLSHPYCRMAVTDSFQQEGIAAQLTVSVWKEGHGSAIIIVPSEKSHSVEELLKLTQAIQKKLQENNGEVIREELSKALGKLLDVEPEAYQIGKPYPFYDFCDEGGNIPAVQEFVGENYQAIYGVLHQDVTGWRRTKAEIARGFLEEDLSRRNEYAFYISQVASVEIDDATRMNNVRKWAAEQNVPVPFLQTKLILERLLVLETLVMQKHLLLCIYDRVEQVMKQAKPKYLDILATQMQITRDLCDFYLLRSQDESHVSGVEWREYGQKQFGTEKLYESLMTRISLIEAISREQESADMEKKTYVISIFSFALSLSTIITIFDWFFTAPFLQMTTGNIIWYTTLLALVLTGAIMLVWYQSDGRKKKSTNKRKKR